MELATRECLLVALIKQYRDRGWGTYRIGRLLWPYLNPRTAQKRVQRLLQKWGPSCLNIPAGVSIDVSINNRGTRRRGWDPEDVKITRLGRTQKLVVAALKTLGGRARFSTIVSEVASMLGLEAYSNGSRKVLRNRVWQALNRLVHRGIVLRSRGVYWLAHRYGSVGLFVENFRVQNGRGTLQVWSKRDMGRPASLDEALILATLRGARRTVQVEIATILPSFDKFMSRRGISIIKIYRDPHPPYRGKAKLEVSIEGPILYPHIVARDDWVRFQVEVLASLARLLRGGGRLGVSQ